MFLLDVDDMSFKIEPVAELPAAFAQVKVGFDGGWYAHGSFGRILCLHMDAGPIVYVYHIYRPLKDCRINLRMLSEEPTLHIVLAEGRNYLHSKKALEIPCKEGAWVFFPKGFGRRTICLQKGKEYTAVDIGYKSCVLCEHMIEHYANLLLPELFGPETYLAKHVPRLCPPAVRVNLHEMMINGFSAYRKQLFVQKKAEELLLYWLEQNDRKPEKENTKAGYQRMKEQLYAIKQLIESNQSEHYTIAVLAKKAGMNTADMKKGFKQLFGMGPFEYLTILRMERAQDLLCNKRLPVWQVAADCGYLGVGSFVKAFKRKYGHTPGYMQRTAMHKESD